MRGLFVILIMILSFHSRAQAPRLPVPNDIASVLSAAYRKLEADAKARKGDRYAQPIVEDELAAEHRVRTLNWNSRETCRSSEDISKKLGPVRDQFHRGWCYAEPAADLATAATGEYISSADIAIHYNDADSTKERCSGSKYAQEGGTTFSALDDFITKKIGFCRETDLPSKGLMTLSQAEFHHRIRNLQMATNGRPCPKQTNEALAQIFSVQNQNELVELAKTLKSSSETDFLAKLANKKCEGRRLPLYARIEGSSALSRASPLTKKAALFSMIDQLKVGVPVAVSFDIAALLRPSFLYHFRQDLKKNPFSCEAATDLANELLGPLSDGTAPHAMTAVGLRFDEASRKCLVRLRNSWGHDCSEFTSQAHCSTLTGEIQIPLDQLSSVLNETTYLSR